MSSQEDDQQSNNTVIPSRFPMPKLRANTQRLSDSDVLGARLTEVGHGEYYREGIQAARSELTSMGLSDWRIDEQLSNTEGVVFIQEETGNIRVAYRGTDWSNTGDILGNTHNLLALQAQDPQNRAAISQIERIQNKYGHLPERLHGYSKGGANAIYIGDRFEIPTTTYNPAIGPQQVMTRSRVPHEIIRTIDDPVSLGLSIAQHKANYTVRAIDPIIGEGGPETSHRLRQFTTRSVIQPSHDEGQFGLDTDMARRGSLLAEMETFDEFARHFEDGMTFSEALQKFNGTQQIDVQPDGRLGTRITEESGSVKYWKQLGGELSTSESADIARNTRLMDAERTINGAEPRERPAGYGQQLNEQQIEHLTSLSPAERTSFLERQRTAFTRVTDQTIPRGSKSVRSRFIPRTSSIAGGIASAVGAHEIMELYDPDHTLTAVQRDVGEGFFAGLGVAGTRFLGANVELAPEVSAAIVGYVVGERTSDTVYRAMIQSGADETAAGYTSAAAGGAAGGASAAATASIVNAAIAAARTALLGAEAGAATTWEGGPLGEAFGITAGAVIGAGVGVSIYAITGNLPESYDQMQERLESERADEASHMTERNTMSRYIDERLAELSQFRNPHDARIAYDAAIRAQGLNPLVLQGEMSNEQLVRLHLAESQLGMRTATEYIQEQNDSLSHYRVLPGSSTLHAGNETQESLNSRLATANLRAQWNTYSETLATQLRRDLPADQADQAIHRLGLVTPRSSRQPGSRRAELFIAMHQNPEDWNSQHLATMLSHMPFTTDSNGIETSLDWHVTDGITLSNSIGDSLHNEHGTETHKPAQPRQRPVDPSDKLKK